MGGHVQLNRIEAWLAAARSIWLSTTRPDVRPHCVPVWFWWDGAAVYFNTSPRTQKGRNLAVHPWAVAHLGDGDDTLILEGPVTPVIDPVELERIDVAFRSKYVDPNSGASAGFPHTEDGQGFRLDTERMLVWEYGIVATRTDFARDGSGNWVGTAP